MRQRNDTQSAFVNILTKVNENPIEEFEVRFHGRMSNIEKEHFVSKIQPTVYFEVLDRFKKGMMENTIECEQENYVSTTIHNRPERLVHHADGKTEIIRKERILLPRPFSIISYVNPRGFKITLAKETILKDETNLIEQEMTRIAQHPKHKDQILQRKIERTTFLQYIHDEHSNKIIVFRFDFSKVWDNTKEMPHFEIEMEYVGNKQKDFLEDMHRLLDTISDRFLSNLETMLKWIQNSDNVVTWTEHNSILQTYNSLMTSHRSAERIIFRGVQPKTLHMKHLSEITSNPYFVGDKSDGERAHAFYDSEGTLHLVSRYLYVTKTDVVDPLLRDSIFDAEWFPDKKLVLLFDILMLHGKDLRSQTTKRRVEELVNVKISSTTLDTESIQVKIKKLFYSPQKKFPRKEINALLSRGSMDYEIDGLIFTPADMSYFDNSRLYKWKPPEFNSIDLYVERDDIAKGYKLFVHSLKVIGSDGKVGVLIRENPDSLQVQFEDENPTLVHPIFCHIVKGKTEKARFYPFPFLSDDKITYKSLMRDQHVIEFIYDNQNKCLSPIRIRDDKSSLSFRGSNFLTVALDNWETMLCPIVKDHLLKYTPGSTRKKVAHKAQQQLSNSFRYHNIVKEIMLRKNATSMKIPYTLMMKRFPTAHFDPKRGVWIIPILPEIESIFKARYSNIAHKIDQNAGEIIVPVPLPVWKMQKIRLLDMCTGKGGDLWKWLRSDVKVVLGLDNERGLLVTQEDAAVHRWRKIRADNTEDVKESAVYFVQMDARSSVSNYLESKRMMYDFHIASCFFAIHYFFGNQDDLYNFFKNVREMLCFSGFFFGMTMDGAKLYNLLEANGGTYEIKDKKENVLCSIQRKYSRTDKPLLDRDAFGLEIEVDIKDSILHDYLPEFNKNASVTVKKEYLVDMVKFKNLASHFGLELVEQFNLNDVIADKNHIWNPRHFSVELSEAEREFTSLFMGFTFQKTTNSLFWQTQKVDESYSNHEYQWLKNWQGLQDRQLETLSVDEIVYQPATEQSVPLFPKLNLKSQKGSINVGKRKPENPPAITIDLKRVKCDGDEDEKKVEEKKDVQLFFTKAMWNNMIQKINT